MPLSTSNSLTLQGPTSDSILSVQDGTGRVQLRWNCTNQPNSKYIKSNEEALWIHMHPPANTYFNIYHANKGTANNTVNFNSHFSIKQNGNVGIGTTSQDEKLMVNGNIKSKKIILDGGTSDSIMSVQDGTGRLQLRWNSSSGNNSTYLNSNEPALFIDMNCIHDNYYKINYAQGSTAGEEIIFNTHLAINQNGNIGIGTTKQTEKLDVNGNIRCNNIILNTNTFVNNLASNTTFVNSLATSLNTGITNIFENVKHACSTGKMIINEGSYTCSGSFITLDNSDLSQGLFLTAAHCVMDITDGVVYKATSFWVTNPINNNWVSVNVSNIYYDGIADVAIIRTNIDFTNDTDKILTLSDTYPVTGDICYVCGDPGGYDTDSMSSGIIRDAHYCDSGGYQITDSLFITAPGIGGNSGSPILNSNGEVIGIFTFGYSNYTTLGGGSNLSTLKKVLPILTTFQNNKSKKYLGLNFYVPSPYTLQSAYNTSSFPNKGLYISSVSANSPFNGILTSGDVILSATAGSNQYEFGHINNQRILGELCYEYSANTINITYIRNSDNTEISTNVTFTTTYVGVNDNLDGPLIGGSSEINENRPTNKLQNIRQPDF